MARTNAGRRLYIPLPDRLCDFYWRHAVSKGFDRSTHKHSFYRWYLTADRPDRWSDVYCITLADLENEWKSTIVSELAAANCETFAET